VGLSLLAETGFVINRDSKEPDMRTATRVSRRIARMRALWSELEYVQRRVLENRTGVPFVTPEERRRSHLRVSQLEYLYRT
jgi:hypothetical protein